MLKIHAAEKFQGEISVPGDKSISHRAIMLGALAKGKTTITNFLLGEDCLATVDCFKKLGTQIEVGDRITVKGLGLSGFKAPQDTLYVGNSGTTIRILSGILAGQPFTTEITGDASIQKRPMKRIIDPLAQMGAIISGKKEGEQIYPPLRISGGKLRPITYKTPVASAQVKSAVLLAGLFAEGTTGVLEPEYSRDHTERMLKYFGARVRIEEKNIYVNGGPKLTAKEVDIPGDISSAAYFLVAAAIIPGAEIVIRDIGLNPTRTGILEVLRRMGAKVEVFDEEIISGEPRGTIRVQGPGSRVQKIKIGGELIPRLIDEIPIITVLATQAEGQTVISDAKELRVKESDRIAAMCSELNKMGAKITPTEDGMIINGPTPLKGSTAQSYGDHRIAMSLAIAGLIADGETIIQDTECINTSFPGFSKLLEGLAR
ncbi:MAG: 3-phosphoshikimate 1-carboxyvinyltransferase [Candidatus Saganbacteria bacterium]|nr:3-phosphoshikimate 1-carboxyvinyltransferase [Candidatus Saganbacteria bacterium]